MQSSCGKYSLCKYFTSGEPVYALWKIDVQPHECLKVSKDRSEVESACK
jgi:hypothetical protein